MVPLIGLTSYGRQEKVVINPPDDAHYLVAATYVDAVRAAGGAPVILPGDEPHPDRWLDALDGIVFTGGGDLDPALYGGDGAHPSLGTVCPDRDRAEIGLTRALLARGDVPALFICRGIQVLNVAMGGTLHEHIADPGALHRADRATGAFWARERVTVGRESILSAVLGRDTITVSSSHHQAIRTLAPGLRVTATADDGTIEAVESTAHPFVLGVQWHPEADFATDPLQLALFRGLVDAADPARVRRRAS
ncbi:gamma-glutamyl-gamma-aminobutyrate hydrolase family protein [Oceaniglobus indicus]|uniref:gamma-glutamyl-gamma-aminobutyrate hydrolase family protein n=1 Tax=Oceaniglobus indicus TaxID=2047749 RepID=UPI0011AB620E|nr:gamma-glutamyl-gamma-aminobutyrate hydrolase family protein [Oceaniglobus indicus]